MRAWCGSLPRRSGVFWLLRDRLPALIDPAALRQIADVGLVGSPVTGLNLGLLLLDGGAALLLALAAVRYARLDRPTSGIPRSYLVVGLVVAAFSQIHFVLYPAVYTNLVSTGDALRLAWNAVEDPAGAQIVLVAITQSGAPIATWVTSTRCATAIGSWDVALPFARGSACACIGRLQPGRGFAVLTVARPLSWP